MSRIYAIFISLLYAVGGLVTGYYGYALRLKVQAAEAGVDLALITDFVQSNYFVAGPVLLILAFFLHMSQIGKAKRVDSEHNVTEHRLNLQVEENKGEIAAIKAQVAENASLIEFCRNAIADAATKKVPTLPASQILTEEEIEAQFENPAVKGEPGS